MKAREGNVNESAFGSIKANPTCSVCGTAVPDLTVNHHVCVPDARGDVVTDAGTFSKTTRDEAPTFIAVRAATEAAAAAAAAEAAALAPPPPVIGEPADGWP